MFIRDNRRKIDKNPNLIKNIDGESREVVKCFKYLNCVIDENLKVSEH